ncbi:MAG: hypothetical protein IJ906_03075 [Oscillospiraceae bacterium]|nr:hypothetical protein [Oscillospiraceae bacterium]
MRLTTKEPSGKWSLRGVDLQALQPEVYGALCKLLAYEETGLDPDEVERMKDASELLHIGSMIEGYEIIGIYDGMCIGRQRYGGRWAVWHLDADLCGVWGGRYFSGEAAKQEAEQAFCADAFELRMVEQLRALTEEVEGLEAAYDKALHDMLSPSLCSMIQQRVREILR